MNVRTRLGRVGWQRGRAVRAAALTLALVAGCRQPKQAPPTVEGPSSGGSEAAPEVPPSQPAPPFVSIVAGADATCGIAAQGALYCWGRNDLGQVGDGSTTDQLLPSAVGVGTKWKAVAPGGSHTCGLNEQGAAYCWGSSVFGELGSGDTLPSRKPMAVTPGLTFRSMTLTTHSTCALTTDGRLFCWGLNSGGALGFVTTEACGATGLPEGTCALLPKRSAPESRFRHAATAYQHTCGVTDTATVMCWGANSQGQLGNGTHDSAGPTPVAGNLRYAAIGAGEKFTCALESGGDVYCWGLNDDGQLGSGSGADSPEPTALASASKFVSLTVGHEHACGLTTEHEAYCWGSNAHGQLGSVVKLRSFNPAAVVFPQTP